MESLRGAAITSGTERKVPGNSARRDEFSVITCRSKPLKITQLDVVGANRY